MTQIKICGITREEDALFCAAQGADYLGLIFVEGSPRHVTPERAARIADAVRATTHVPRLVGVFVDEKPERVREIAVAVGLDAVQLHGSESDDDCRAVGLPVIKAVRVGDTLPDTSALETPLWLLFDTLDDRRAGGTGHRFDWSLLAGYRRQKPFFLSGGLTPDSVVAAISLVRPDGLDISSGVEESPGIKNHGKVERLFERVRRA
jgi:phosphoribosylanthranilate isomerase